MSKWVKKTLTCQKCQAKYEGYCAKWCAPCRREFRMTPTKHHWTDERDEILRRHFDGLKGSVRRSMRALNLPMSAVKARALNLGLSRPKRAAFWTAEEVAYLQEHGGTMSRRSIAKKLGKSIVAVQSKAHALQITLAVREGHTISSLKDCFGVHIWKVKGWIDKGYFGRVKYRSGKYAPINHADAAVITDAQVLAFVRTHRSVFDLRRVDQIWFLDLVFDTSARDIRLEERRSNDKRFIEAA